LNFHNSFRPDTLYRPVRAREGIGFADFVEGRPLIRLGILDDHPVFRLGLTRAFEREHDMAVLWDLGSLDEMRTLLVDCPVDVVLMDLNLGSDQDALAATTAIREEHDAVKVIVISASLDWDAAAAARAAGANGYLPKDLAIADMVAAIRGLASPNFGRWNFSNMLDSRNGLGSLVSLRQSLTPREQEVLAELRRGRTNKEIARRLGVSITTINKHVQHLLKKLHVRTRAQAVAMVNAEASGRPYRSEQAR
jgi:DNA-binding NarL/FixJ family response regulator